MISPRIPAATYRVQMNSGFTFAQARSIIPFLHELGITDLYGSPILKATPGSQHGYDVVDPNQVNPELGTEGDLRALSADLTRRQMGLLLDIVPNHMATSPQNTWWMNVLENGPESRYAWYFDIEWSPGTRGSSSRRVLLPVLGKRYGEALESKELQLGFEEGGFVIRYYDRTLPVATHTYEPLLSEILQHLLDKGKGSSGSVIELTEIVELLRRAQRAVEAGNPRQINSRYIKEALARLDRSDRAFAASLRSVLASYNGEKGESGSFDKLDYLLDNQWYRLSYWRLASHEINYRRFFDVTDLIGVRIEEPEVFEARLSRVFELIAQGVVTGLRVDHIDGLYDPIGHLRRLQSRIDSRWSGRDDRPAFYVVVEKILAHDEALPPDFAASGTTGYDYLNLLNDVFVDGRGLDELQLGYAEAIGGPPFDEMSYATKKRVMDELFAGEVRALTLNLQHLASFDRDARDFAPGDLAAVFVEVTACLSVYRTYVRQGRVSDSDREVILSAVKRAEERAPDIHRAVFEFVREVLLLIIPPYAKAHEQEWLDFVMNWQQFTGRVMAKGVEDTAFYMYNRLVSRNEVGGEPGVDVEDGAEVFHRRIAERHERWPGTMNATSTHDTKRSEDVRARINVLSEIAAEWNERVRRWNEMNAALRTEASEGASIPDRNDESLVYQTLIGAWPLDEADLPSFRDRLDGYFEKALREAKVHTTWLRPVPEYENGVKSFVRAVTESETFLADFEPLARRVAHYGFLNSLAQVVVKIASPGVPDFYQGTEMWDLSLVDPDNRRPVDYELRQRLLSELNGSTPSPELAAQLLGSWKDGRVKLFTTSRGLRARRDRQQLFIEGSYEPLATPEHLFGFVRRHESNVAVALVPRHLVSLISHGEFPLGDKWADATIELPADVVNIFTNETHAKGTARVADVLRAFPVALLVG